MGMKTITEAAIKIVLVPKTGAGIRTRTENVRKSAGWCFRKFHDYCFCNYLSTIIYAEIAIVAAKIAIVVAVTAVSVSGIESPDRIAVVRVTMMTMTDARNAHEARTVIADVIGTATHDQDEAVREGEAVAMITIAIAGVARAVAATIGVVMSAAMIRIVIAESAAVASAAVVSAPM